MVKWYRVFAASTTSGETSPHFFRHARPPHGSLSSLSSTPVLIPSKKSCMIGLCPCRLPATASADALRGAPITVLIGLRRVLVLILSIDNVLAPDSTSSRFDRFHPVCHRSCLFFRPPLRFWPPNSKLPQSVLARLRWGIGHRPQRLPGISQRLLSSLARI